MGRQVLAKEIYKDQKLIGNCSLSQDDIDNIINQLTKKTNNLLRKKNLLDSQKAKVDKDLLKTEEEILKNKNRLDFIFQNYPKLSLIFKKQKSKKYIKGRFWWEGKQRDVQIGSEHTLLKNLIVLSKNKVIKKMKLSSKDKITWDLIKQDKNLFSAVNKIGYIKASGYVLKKIKNEILNVEKKQIKKTNYNAKSSKSMKSDRIGLDWYSEWKNKNFNE